MNNRRAVLIAGVLVGISLILVSFYVTVKESELTSSFGEGVDVVIADGPYFEREKSKTIPEYTVIQPDMVRTVKIFKNFKQPLTITKPEDIIGKATYVPLARGEQVTLTKLVSQDGKPLLDRQLEKKTRAVTVMISPHTGVGRLIRPGNHVDIIVSPTYDKDGQTVLETKTMLQNVLVVATGKHIMNEVPSRVDRELLGYIEEVNARVKRKDLFGGSPENLQTSRPDDNYASVTFQLGIEDAERLLFLTQKFGDRAVYLTLRRGTDVATEKLPTTLLADVLGPDSDYGRSLRKPPPVQVPNPKYIDLLGAQPVKKY